MIPHNKVVAEQDDAASVAEVVLSGHWAMGPVTEKLEARLAQVCNRRHAIFVASGLSALRLSLIALEIDRGDRVGVPAYSCVALANAVLSLGADPVPIDCSADRLTISPTSLTDEAYRGLRCLLVVNTFGVAADFSGLRKLGIPLIEDCTHGFGYGALGKHGDATVISFHATKFVGSGRGGAILTDDDLLAQRVRDLREYDDRPASARRINDKPDDLNAALALNRLRCLDTSIFLRQSLALAYQSAFRSVADGGKLTLPPDLPDRVWYRYIVHATNDAVEWIRRLEDLGVQAAEPVTNWLDNRQLASCPNADRAYRLTVSLPFFPTLTSDEQRQVICAVASVAASVASR